MGDDAEMGDVLRRGLGGVAYGSYMNGDGKRLGWCIETREECMIEGKKDERTERIGK